MSIAYRKETNLTHHNKQNKTKQKLKMENHEKSQSIQKQLIKLINCIQWINQYAKNANKMKTNKTVSVQVFWIIEPRRMPGQKFIRTLCFGNVFEKNTWEKLEAKNTN